MDAPFRLMLVTDRTLVPPGRLPDVIDAAISGGVDAVQLREKDLPRSELLGLGATLREVTRGRALLLVNGRPALAQACGADGVHLPESASPAPGPHRGLIVGRSVHSRAAARSAEREGCDYLVLGTIFPSRSHPGGRSGGAELVCEVASAVAIPVAGIGGITHANVGEVVRAGACGVAVISSMLAAPDPAAAARSLRAAVDAALLQPARDRA